MFGKYVVCVMLMAAGCSGAEDASAPMSGTNSHKATTTSQDGHSTAGAAGFGATKLTGLGIAGMGAGGEPAGEPAGEPVTLEGAAGAAGSQQQGSAGSAPARGTAGSAGSAGAIAATGAGGAEAAGGTAGAGGAAGSSTAGTDGAAGSSAETVCPLGDQDADGNGYPDACETVLWSAEGSSSTPINIVGLNYAPGMVGFFEVTAGDSVHCATLNGTGIPSLGHATPFPAGHAPSSQIIDAQSDLAARTLATCFERGTVPVSLEGSVASASVADASGARALYDTQPFRNHLNAGVATPDVAIAGKRVLYFRVTMKRLSIAAFDGTVGTTVSAFDATVDAIGY